MMTELSFSTSFSSTHSSIINLKRHIQSPDVVCSVPLWEQSIWRRRIYSRRWITVALLARPARNKLADSAISIALAVISSNTFCSAISHCIKVVITELALKQASLSTDTRLQKPCHFPRKPASTVLLEWIDQMKQKIQLFFPLLAKRLNPLSPKDFLPPSWVRLIPLCNWELPSASWSQQAGKGVKLFSFSASQSRFQAHFFHHLFIYSPCHCCHQSTPEGTGHSTSEKADQPKVLQQEINSNPLLSASSILTSHITWNSPGCISALIQISLWKIQA